MLSKGERKKPLSVVGTSPPPLIGVRGIIYEASRVAMGDVVWDAVDIAISETAWYALDDDTIGDASDAVHDVILETIREHWKQS